MRKNERYKGNARYVFDLNGTNGVVRGASVGLTQGHRAIIRASQRGRDGSGACRSAYRYLPKREILHTEILQLEIIDWRD